VLAIAFIGSAVGCGTCVTINGTYEEIWDATESVLAELPDQSAALPRRVSFVEGTIEVVTLPRFLGGEMHHHAQIEPAGGDEARDYKLCVRVRHLDPRPGDPDSMKAHRRSDIEQALADEIKRRVDPTPGPTPTDPPADPARSLRPQRLEGARNDSRFLLLVRPPRASFAFFAANS